MKHKLLLFFTLITTFLQAQGFNQYDRLWSTYVGGNGLDFPMIVKDNNGNIIVVGSISTSDFSFQNSVYREYYQSFIYPENNLMMFQSNDYYVSFITKFSPNGTLIKASYFPFSITDIVTKNNKIIIRGITKRRDLGTANVWFTEPNINWNRAMNLITTLDNDFNTIWTSYLPINYNNISLFDMDEEGNIYGTGSTNINNGITTGSTFYPEFTSIDNDLHSGNGLIFKLNSNGQLVWSTYYGMSEILSIKYHNDKLYIIANKINLLNDSTAFPWITENAYQTTQAYSTLARFNPSNGQRELATYYGESDKLTLSHIEVNNDAIYIAGDTSIFSDNTPFITSNSYQSVFGGGSLDYYLAKLDLNFNPIWGTYIGETETDLMEFETKNLHFFNNHLYLADATRSTNISLTENTFRSTNAGNYDLLIMKFNPYGQLVWGSFYGSNGIEDLSSLLPIDDETFYLAGLTDSPKDITTPNSYQQYYSYLPNNGDFGQLFLAKFGRNDDLSTSDISTSTLKIYPNPTKDKVYIKGFIHQDSLIEVYNLVGQIISNQKTKSGLIQTIDVQFLPKGMYIIKAIDINGKVFQEKLIKE